MDELFCPFPLFYISDIKRATFGFKSLISYFAMACNFFRTKFAEVDIWVITTVVEAIKALMSRSGAKPINYWISSLKAFPRPSWTVSYEITNKNFTLFAKEKAWENPIEFAIS